MAFRIQIGPPQIAIHQGTTVMVSELDGQVRPPGDKGLYFRDTRVLSAWAITANGEPWALLNGGTVTYFAGRVFMTNRAFTTTDGPVPAHSIGLVLSRFMGSGMHEDLDLVNHGPKPVAFNLEILVGSDFADIFEVRGGSIVRRGHVATEWSDERQALWNTYRNGDFCRALHVLARRSASPAAYVNGRIVFEVALPPGGTWHTCLHYELAVNQLGNGAAILNG